jgi:hypothetical protein
MSAPNYVNLAVDFLPLVDRVWEISTSNIRLERASDQLIGASLSNSG